MLILREENIKDFITVNFDSLPKIIDKVGGVSLEVDASEVKYFNNKYGYS